ncbi:MAG: D-2-hydroxyacid dehydrogenase family protein [Beijerinckiaceae bacterium]|nr:D-2-hydroxyacid dehydrogenase family protein [Beijerinckiaceae bacterium]
MTSLPRIAILDDSQHVARSSADWSVLDGRAHLAILSAPFESEDAAAAALQDFEILVPMRERTPLPGSLLERLPRLKMIALTGVRSPSLDLVACDRLDITVCNTAGDQVTPATAELAFALILAAARDLAHADRRIREGGWHEHVRIGIPLAGKTLGVVGLGRLGKIVARYGKAFGMDVIAWSQNLTAEAAEEGGARLVSKAELFSTADVVSLHLVLSARTRGVVGAAEINALKPGAILVNTARGPLIEREPFLARLRKGDLFAGLDVHDQEPMPKDDPFRSLPNVVLAPHLGYSTDAVFRQFYGQSLENILAFLDGKPIRLLKAG